MAAPPDAHVPNAQVASPGNTAERLTWGAPGLGLAALGLASSEPLFEGAAAELPRSQSLEPGPARVRLRFALPGTPDVRGNLSGRPGPLGTGWLELCVFRGDWRALWRARSTHPRSASLAEREWNLLCHLRAHGVGTPEPVLVGARGRGLVSPHSFLLVRAPEDAFPLLRWLRTDGIGAERERGLEALGKALALLRHAGVELPQLAAEHLWLVPSGSGECETQGQGGLRKNKLPGVILVDVRGGRIGGPGRAGLALEGLLADLEAACSAEERARLERFARA